MGVDKKTATSAFQSFDELKLRQGIHLLVDRCHKDAFEAGWWPILEAEGPGSVDIPLKLCLIHSEISEAMEGHRKNLLDTHLQHRSMLEVELADAVIRIADLAGALGLDLGGAVVEKLAYNTKREDHKASARAQAEGKKY